MADRTLQAGDTDPPLKGTARDPDGSLANLPAAASLEVICRSRRTTISGFAVPIDPPEVVGAETFNWQYALTAGDTDFPGTYRVYLRVTWDANSNPPRVETYPSDDNACPILVIERR